MTGTGSALQNRVTPFGEIIRTPAHGTLMGNRGRLHHADRELGRRRWTTRAWIACRLEFQGRRRQVMAPGRYTELFFLDEATALAAGHRPCAECRHGDFVRFANLWAEADGSNAPASRARAGDIDGRLHAERVRQDCRMRSLKAAAGVTLPDGTFIVLPDDPRTAWLVWSGRIHRWTPAGYDVARDVPDGVVAVLTPPSTVRVIAGGYRPNVHPSAQERSTGGGRRAVPSSDAF